MAQYTYTEQKRILGRARCCIADLGYAVVKGLKNGKEVTCEQRKLRWLTNTYETVCRFAPVGTVTCSEVRAYGAILFEDNREGLGPWTVDVTAYVDNYAVTLGSLTGYALVSFSAFLTALAVAINANTGTTGYSAQASGNYLIITAAVGTGIAPNGKNLHADVALTGAGSVDVIEGELDCGRYEEVKGGNCITQDQADDLLEKITQMCCDTCGTDNDLKKDTL